MENRSEQEREKYESARGEKMMSEEFRIALNPRRPFDSQPRPCPRLPLCSSRRRSCARLPRSVRSWFLLLFMSLALSLHF